MEKNTYVKENKLSGPRDGERERRKRSRQMAAEKDELIQETKT